MPAPIEWPKRSPFARDHFDEPLTVEQLAEKANPSPRQFARIFPEEIARATGFNDLERMRRAFLARSASPRRACVESQRWKK